MAISPIGRIRVNVTGARGIKGDKGDPSGPLGAGSVTAATISNDSTEQKAIGAKIGVGREKLTAPRTFYVRPDGSDSNDGMDNTSSRAFATPQRAYTVANTLDLNGFAIDVQIAKGTYTSGLLMFAPLLGAPAGEVGIRFVGDETTPANVVIRPTGSDAISIGRKASVRIAGLTLSTASSGNGIFARGGAYLEHQNCVFAACASETIVVGHHAVVKATGPTSVTGGSLSFIHATKRSIVDFNDQTLTYASGAVFSTYLYGINDASVNFDSGTIIGKASGPILVHIHGTLNVSSLTGDWTGGVAPIERSGGRIINESAVQNKALFVNASTGNDANDGLAIARSFKTIGAAVQALSKLYLDPMYWSGSADPDSGWNIMVAAGTYAETINLLDVPIRGVKIVGDETTPANVIIAPPSGDAFTARGVRSTTWHVRGVTINPPSTNFGISVYSGSSVSFQNIDLGPCTAQLYAENAVLTATGPYKTHGTSNFHLYGRFSGRIDTRNRQLTLASGSSFSQFAYAEIASVITARSMTFSGTATGSRYGVRSGGFIDTNNAGANFFPGDTAGTASNGGQYF